VSLKASSPLGSLGSPAVNGANLLSDPTVISVAEKLEKTPAQVALRWGLQMGQSVLPKSANEARIRENFDIFNWSIPGDLMAKFSEIEQACLNACFYLSTLHIFLVHVLLFQGSEI
jgi:diketogulonate reductase-like aldo/keto reductase